MANDEQEDPVDTVSDDATARWRLTRWDPRGPSLNWLKIAGITGIVALGLWMLYLIAPLFFILYLFFGRVSADKAYGNINKTLEQIDYESSGQIVKVSYNNESMPRARGVLGPSYVDVEVQGEHAFEVLKLRIEDESLDSARDPCNLSNGGNCSLNGVSINLYESDTGASLRVTGRG